LTLPYGSLGGLADSGEGLWQQVVRGLAIGEPGATNAGLLAAQILELSDARLAARVAAYRAAQTDSIAEALEDNA
jgi:phosphoribosylcarboxyaminoimidazole (NCAIR) mutase